MALLASERALKYAFAIWDRPALCTQANKIVAGSDVDMLSVGSATNRRDNHRRRWLSYCPCKSQSQTLKCAGSTAPDVPTYCNYIMRKTCALGKCPAGCGDEVVVTCTGNTLSAATGGVQCRFGSARAAACIYEEESGTLTCCPPKVPASCVVMLVARVSGPSRSPPPCSMCTRDGRRACRSTSCSTVSCTPMTISSSRTSRTCLPSSGAHCPDPYSEAGACRQMQDT